MPLFLLRVSPRKSSFGTGSTYNHDRPHESLDQQTPAEFYQPSVRRLNESDKPFTYAKDQEVKPVFVSVHVAHEGKNYHLGEAFAGKRVGLRRNAAGHTDVSCANVHLGHFAYDAGGGRFKPTAYVAAPARPVPPTPPLNPGKGESQAPSLKPSQIFFSRQLTHQPTPTKSVTHHS